MKMINPRKISDSIFRQLKNDHDVCYKQLIRQLWRSKKDSQEALTKVNEKEKNIDKTFMPDDRYFHREQEKEFNSILKVFATRKNQFLELHRILPSRMTKERFLGIKNRVNKESELHQQKFIPMRHEILGSDLATAHFIVFRGGRVKFEPNGPWIAKRDDDEETCPELPNRFVRNMFLHSIDASGTNIRYEGLENFTNLSRLKWLSFRNGVHVDDWFLDRIAGEFSDTLEYLDVSDCKGITERGLSCIYKLRNLKTLCVTNFSDSRSFEFTCLLLEDTIPNLKIEGVKYLDLDTTV